MGDGVALDAGAVMAHATESAPRGTVLQWILLGITAISFYLTILLDVVGTWSWIALTAFLGYSALRARTRLTRVLALYPLVFLFYVAGRRIADDGFLPVQVDYVIVADRLLGLGHVPTVLLQNTLERALEPALPFLIAVYVSFFFAFVLVAPALFWLDRPGMERMLIAGVIVFLIGLPIHWLLPTAPPWLASLEGHLEPVGRILHDGWLGKQATYELGNNASGNDVSAMPSYHTALTVLVALALARFGRLAAGIGAGYVLVMGFALVYGAEHYVVDLLAAVAIAVLAWRWAPRFLEWLAPDGSPDPTDSNPAEARAT